MIRLSLHYEEGFALFLSFELRKFRKMVEPSGFFAPSATKPLLQKQKVSQNDHSNYSSDIEKFEKTWGKNDTFRAYSDNFRR